MGHEPCVWAELGSLTVAVRRAGDPPFLVGTAHERMRAAGPGIWALRLEVGDLTRACIEYGIVDPHDPHDPRRVEFVVWRGPRGGRPAARASVEVGEAEIIADSALGA
ncbi:MAG: hypothetical protein ABI317_00455, partial [Gaiellales bacterium]